MSPLHLAVVGRHHDDRVLQHAQPFKLVEDAFELHVAVLDAVVVIIAEALPVRRPGRHHADVAAPDLVIFVMGRHDLALVADNFRIRRGDRRFAVALLIDVIAGCAPDHRVSQLCAGLGRLSRRIRVEIHNVVWVDEVDSEEERLALRVQRGALIAQPVGGVGRDGGVGRVALLDAAGRVSVGIPVGEAVNFEPVGGVENGVVGVIVDAAAGQMQLALVGCVIAAAAHDIADGGELRAHRVHIAHVRIVEHLCIGDVAASVDDGAGGGGHGRTDVVFFKRGADVFEPFSPLEVSAGRVFAAGEHVMFLVR